jgi:plasmid maintenance system antidote protein VapI
LRDWKGSDMAIGKSLAVLGRTLSCQDAFHQLFLSWLFWRPERFMPAQASLEKCTTRMGAVSRQMLHDILAERKPLSAVMCLRISRLLGSAPELWMRPLDDYDLKKAAQNVGPGLARAKADASGGSCRRSHTKKSTPDGFLATRARGQSPSCGTAEKEKTQPSRTKRLFSFQIRNWHRHSGKGQERGVRSQESAGKTEALHRQVTETPKKRSSCLRDLVLRKLEFRPLDPNSQILIPHP